MSRHLQTLRRQAAQAKIAEVLSPMQPKRLPAKEWHANQPQQTVSVTFRFLTKTGQAIAVADGTKEINPATGQLWD